MLLASINGTPAQAQSPNLNEDNAAVPAPCLQTAQRLANHENASIIRKTALFVFLKEPNGIVLRTECAMGSSQPTLRMGWDGSKPSDGALDTFSEAAAYFLNKPDVTRAKVAERARTCVAGYEELQFDDVAMACSEGLQFILVYRIP